jgi:hypothetical protein
MAFAALIDHDVAFARTWFGGVVADGRLSDAEVTARAWDSLQTVVTANGGDFVRAFLNHQRTHPCTKTDCHDMNGLIVIPNHEFRAQNAVNAMEKRTGLRRGRRRLFLDNVSDYNLYAKYHADGTVEMKRFPMCQYREPAEADMPPWYRALRVVGVSG